MKIPRLQDIDTKGKNVLLRTDYNVPIKDGKVSDETRILATEKTVKYLLQNSCRVTIASHLGRPKGQAKPEFSLRPVAPVLEKIMGAKVHFVADCVGAQAQQAVSSAKSGEIVLLENLRFHAEETVNDENFARSLAGYGEVFIQDAFGTLHRAHASTAAVAGFLPGAIGFLVQKELEFLDRAIKNPQRPFLVILGGAKISDKLPVINNLLNLADAILIGGAMSYTFLKAQSVSVGDSLVEDERVENAKDVISRAYEKRVECLLPADHLAAKDIQSDAEVQITQSMAIPRGWAGVDIGPRTIAIFTEQIKKAKTIFWNGPLGIFETDAFSRGSIEIAKALVQATKEGVVTIAGGGDSLSVLKKAKIGLGELSHCSTGGGASMEFLEGKILPGLAALSKNEEE